MTKILFLFIMSINSNIGAIISFNNTFKENLFFSSLVRLLRETILVKGS